MKSKGQSTAEYAILIGLVVAVAAALGGVLRAGIAGQHGQALNVLYNAGNGTELTSTPVQSGVTFEQQARVSEVDKDSYKNVEIMKKGGAIERLQRQKVATEEITVYGNRTQ